MIDPELKYCPECEDEYRTEIVMCAACGVELITGRQKIAMHEAKKKRELEHGMELNPDDDLVVIRRGPLSDLRYLAGLLREEHIATLLAGDDNSCGQGCCPTVYNLLVKGEDGLAALHILEEEYSRTTGLEEHDSRFADEVFNPEAAEACCPACGCSFPTSDNSCPDCGLSFA
ncbi:MAG: zinc ribbon-containing (seleno)protein DG [Desulfobulbales bacterium]